MYEYKVRVLRVRAHSLVLNSLEYAELCCVIACYAILHDATGYYTVQHYCVLYYTILYYALSTTLFTQVPFQGGGRVRRALYLRHPPAHAAEQGAPAARFLPLHL